MRLLAFFVCLFFLLLRGYDCVYAGTGHKSISYTPLEHIDKTQQVKYTHYDYTACKDAAIDKGQESFLTDEVEDDDPNSSISRKFKLLAKCYLSLSGSSVINDPGLRSPRPTYSLPSCKYIAQRVLRI